MARNLNVGLAVDKGIERIDSFIGTNKALRILPSAGHRNMFDDMVSSKSASVVLASFFFIHYKLADTDWDCMSIPTGARGVYGDKKLAEALSIRNVTLHNNITAYGENLGWKGAVKTFRLLDDPRFSDFIKAIASGRKNELEAMAEYAAEKYASSVRHIQPLPPVGRDVLTFARAKLLFHRIIGLASEGFVQQFLVASLLEIHRRRYGFEIKTHHVHAADKYDGTAGDIEEFHSNTLVAAYEVTDRPDWINRLSNFKDKMDEFGLSKYVIIASNVNSNKEWGDPESLLLNIEPIGRDIAVVDLKDFINVFASELTPIELRDSVNRTYEMLCSPKLCGRADFQDAYTHVVSEWLNSAGQN